MLRIPRPIDADLEPPAPRGETCGPRFEVARIGPKIRDVARDAIDAVRAHDQRQAHHWQVHVEWRQGISRRDDFTDAFEAREQALERYGTLDDRPTDALRD